MTLPLKICEFGSDTGKRVVYFHGAPGVPEECAIFDSYGKEHGLRFICLDRFSVDSSIVGRAYYQLLAQEISKLADGQQVDVVAFSIGAFIALQTCPFINCGVRNLHLVSAAAPIEAGDFLSAMSGKRVFQIAKAFPVLFVLLSYGQRLLALLFPNLLFRLVFADAKGRDKTLATDPHIKSCLTNLLKLCFVGGIEGYLRDIKAYVGPWQATLSEISVPTHIWHGAEDNWAPKIMAEYLYLAIPGCSHIEITEELSHYSCLYDAAPKLCNQLSKA